MNELYFPEAVILDKEDANDIDLRYSIYAKDFGKFFAKAKSARKITSKLAGHLEPGNLVKMRVVGNGSFQMVDALKMSRVMWQVSDLYLLNQLLPEEDFDLAVWEELTDARNVGVHECSNVAGERGGPCLSSGREFSWLRTLKILGWDPEMAICYGCERNRPTAFFINGQNFLCDECFISRDNFLEATGSFGLKYNEFIQLAT